MAPDLFDHAFEIARSMSGELGERLRSKSHRGGVKVWFDVDDAPRVHFEAQVVARRHVDGADGAVVEVGLHSELKVESANEDELRRWLDDEPRWRPLLGSEAVAGAFLGASKWRRVSDVWLDIDLSTEDPDDLDEIAMEIGSRLADYFEAFEPLL